MAKGKRGSGKHYVSKGERPNVSRAATKEGRREYNGSLAQLHNQWKAFQKGRQVSKAAEELFTPAAQLKDKN